MVKNILIDCENLIHKEQAHAYLAQVLEFPGYYGKNLDALFDCLTELGECTVVLKGENILRKTENYGTKVLKVLEEAAQVNSRLKLEIYKVEPSS